MPQKKITAPLLAIALGLALCATTIADTIHLRDGSVIRGQIIAFKDQQFTVLIGTGTRGRRSRITLYMEDVDSIEFDSALGSTTTGAAGIGDVVGGGNPNNDADDNNRPTADNRPAPTLAQPPPTNTGRTNAPTNDTGTPAFFPIRLRVRADSTNNGWNDAGLMVRRGQHLRITASGRVSLGNGVFATPTGLPRVADNDKLMRNEPTGALIAVIGDDNDEFIFVGASREIVATRDGRLFLGVNESNLADNSGTYDVTVEAEALAGNR